MEHTSSPQPAVRRRFVPRQLVAAVAIVATITLLGGGVAVAQRGGERSHHARPHPAGTVTSISAPNFDIERRNGDAATIVTTADTKYSKTSDASVADAVPGSYVVVRGERSEDGTTVAARHIHIRPAPSADKEDHRPRSGVVLTNDGTTLTVQKANTASPNAGVLTVTTTADTKVRKTTEASFDDLAVGQFVHLGGTRNDDGTFTARRVAIDTSTRPARAPKPETTQSSDSPRVQGTNIAATDNPASSNAAQASNGAPPHRPAAGSAVRVGGLIAIDGTSFTINNRRRAIVVHTSDATTYWVRNDDGTVTTGSFADLEVGDRVGVAGVVQEDGSVQASKVRTGSDDDGARAERREERPARDGRSGGR